MLAARKSQFGVTTTVTKRTVTDAPNGGSVRLALGEC